MSTSLHLRPGQGESDTAVSPVAKPQPGRMNETAMQNLPLSEEKPLGGAKPCQLKASMSGDTNLARACSPLSVF